MAAPECPAPLDYGFTLTEVVVAIGIISFGIVAIIGLLSVSLEVSRESSDDTRLAAMTSLVMDRVRTQPFDEIPARINVEFDHDGNEITSGKTSGESYYGCEVRTSPSSVPLSDHLLRLEIRFEWPTGVTPAPNERIVHGSVARR